MNIEEYGDFIKNINKYPVEERLKLIPETAEWIKKEYWPIAKDQFERILSSASKKEVIKAFFKNDESFQYVWDLLDIPDNLKWGLEIEVCNLQLEKIKYFFRKNLIREFMDYLGVPKFVTKKILMNSEFEGGGNYSKWNFTKEAGYQNSEASSPIYKNDITQLNEVSAMTTLLKALGAETDYGTGLHINIGVDYLECNGQALTNLLKIWGECEELFYKMATPVGEPIRKIAERMAGPIKENIQDYLETDGSVTLKTEKDKHRFLFQIQQKEEDLGPENEKLRWTSINFNHMGLSLKNPGRIEMRLFNSSLEPDIIFQDLLISSKLFEASLKTAKDPEYKKEEFQNLLRRSLSEKEKVEALLNLLFDKEEQKEIFRKRWESVKDNPEYKKYRSGKDTFER